MSFSIILAVAFGSALGGLVRFLAREWAAVNSWQAVTLSTLFVNILGCFIAGFLLVYWQNHPVNAYLRTGIIVGFLGALTTFSSFATETLVYWQHQQFLKAFLYAMANVSICLIAVSIGAWIGVRIAAN